MSVIVNPKRTTIGAPVVGGTPSAVLFVDSSGNLAQDNPAFTYDSTNDTLSVVGAADALRLILKGNATQTANILDIRKSDNTVYWGFGGDGFIYRGTSLYLHDTGSGTLKNIFLGVSCGNATVTGTDNFGIGDTLSALTDGTHNIGIGDLALNAITSNTSNIAIGPRSLMNSTGDINVAIGYRVMENATIAAANVGIGEACLFSLSTGGANVAIGRAAMQVLTDGSWNFALGASSCASAVHSSGTMGLGGKACFYVTGDDCIGIGYETTLGAPGSTGNRNIGIGARACHDFTSGNNNVGVGFEAGYLNVTGDSNVYLGYNAGRSGSSTTASNTILLGANTAVAQSNCMILGGSSSNAVDVRIGGTTASARLHIESAVRTTGSLNEFLLVGAAHTTLTASTEASDVLWNLGRTVQFSTGNITTQRATQILAPTYSFVGASTITNAATFYIEKAPVAGTNATITNKYAVWIDADTTRLDGDLDHRGTNLGFYGVTPAVRSASYTASNVTTDRSYDANATTLDEIADVLGTLIGDLQLTGIIG